VGRAGKEFDYLVRKGIGAGSLSRRCPLVGHGVVVACRVMV